MTLAVKCMVMFLLVLLPKVRPKVKPSQARAEPSRSWSPSERKDCLARLHTLSLAVAAHGGLKSALEPS